MRHLLCLTALSLFACADDPPADGDATPVLPIAVLDGAAGESSDAARPDRDASPAPESSDAASEPRPDAGPRSDSGAETDAGPRSDSGAEADAAPNPGVDAAPDPDAAPEPEPDPDAAPDPDPEPEPDPPIQERPRPDLSDPGLGASWRYGGGSGYPDRVLPADADFVVATRAELEAALEEAVAGQVVYVADDAEIDLTGATLCVPGGVWLAGSRGRNQRPGALLYTTETVRDPILRACGDDVRITGLRLLGADPGQCPPEYPDACTRPDRTGGANCRDCTTTSVGILARGVDGLEVDNCELAGWSLGGVQLVDSVGNHVHHSHIHHTWRQGLGYGVLISRGGTDDVQVLVEWNRFDRNRHAIAGSGEPGQDYEARHNLVLPVANGHVFDMHGHNENTDNGSPLAGGEILVHQNTILPANVYALVVRGRPDHGSWFFDNCLARRSADAAVLQRFFFGAFHVDRGPDGPAPNRYGQSASDCEPLRWCFSRSGQGPWTYLTASTYGLEGMALADLDGNGRADVFRTDGEAWWWSRDARNGWERRNVSGATLDSMAFGDFDGDGAADVFQATGRVFRISSGGANRWQDLREATERLDEIALGDFDGDGATDVFRATGDEWQWSRSGRERWRRLNVSNIGLAGLRFGDFDGDGITDVFRARGGEWQWSRGGAEPWARLNASGQTDLRFADVDGDGTTDVLRQGSDAWWVSHGGATPWRRLRIDSEADGVFADLNADGAADLFRTGCL